MTTESEPNVLQKSIEAMIPRLTETVAAELRQKALNSLQYQVSSAIETEVKKYIVDVIIPSVKDELVKHEAEFKAAVLASVKGTIMLVSEQILAKATERLAGYQGAQVISDIMESCFGRLRG